MKYKLPDGWEIAFLPEIASSNKYSIKRGPFGSALKKEYFKESGYKVYQQMNAIRNDFTIGSYYIDENKYSELIAFEIKPKDIIISCSGTIGKIAVAPNNIEKGVINQALLKISLDETKCLINYFVLFFKNYVAKGEIDQNTKGAAIKNIASVKELKKLPIPLPPLPEQKRIVEKLDKIFSRLDKAISQTEENLKKLDELWQSVLGEVFEGNEEWETKTINEIALVKGGKRLPKGMKLKTEKTKHPYLRVKDFSLNGDISTKNLMYIDDVVFEKIKNYTITSKEFYISIAGTIGITGIVQDFLSGSNLTENAAKLVFKEELNLRYFYFFTLSNYFKNQVNEHTKAVAQPKLALSRIKQIEVRIPLLSKQQEIVTYLDSMSDKIEKSKEETKEKLENLKALKASILDRAFRGEI
jgi:type I restriction enzyme S subunit